MSSQLRSQLQLYLSLHFLLSSFALSEAEWAEDLLLHLCWFELCCWAVYFFCFECSGCSR